MVTRLTGGLTPANAGDPRTFPAIWNTTAGEIETAQSDITSAQSDITTLQSDITTAQSDITTAQSDITTAQSDITTLQSDVTDRVVKDNATGAPFLIWGEETSTPPVSGGKLSLGNGSTVSELVMPQAGSITKLTMYVVTPSGTNTLQLLKNGVLQGAGYQVSTSGSTAVATLATPLAFSSGDSINLQFTAVGGGGVVGSIFGYWA